MVAMLWCHPRSCRHLRHCLHLWGQVRGRALLVGSQARVRRALGLATEGRRWALGWAGVLVRARQAWG